MNLNERWTFPVPSSNIHSKVLLTFVSGNAYLRYDYYDEDNNGVYNGGIVFHSVVAHRHSNEKFTKYIAGTYDTLSEVSDSIWVKELSNISLDWASQYNMRHYIIYLDSYGLYEFIASDFELLETKKGALKGEY